MTRGLDPLERYYGSMLGLAIGDAMGAPVEGLAPGMFPKVTNFSGGGVNNIEPGEWTDDTALAMCLAESLVAKNGFDAPDAMDRIRQWWRAGYWSCREIAFGIGTTTQAAIEYYEAEGAPFSGLSTESSASNGSLMRLAPVPLYYAESPKDAIQFSGDSSRLTHAARLCVDACRYYGALIVGAVQGVPKDELLAPGYSPVRGVWLCQPLTGEVENVARGSYWEKAPPAIRGRGDVISCMEAALWAFASTDNFADGVIAAVNLGEDADTTAAVYGQLAGAYYGISSIPDGWRDTILYRKKIIRLAERLYQASRELAGK
ncbi:ADP-ribosylglycohydrolase family protein [Cerasicoccus fimbriatus]|uniref:ADP-ribosylglycohydrolase family protein n=1 Tax=Cerasicoccus fimbriatus TaxID=3014554 RepID=UPI0022B5C1AE|nr:ADP-ribosylglycohydrolase family protein [Cerasicoccus sp. TK19100]